MMAAKEENWVGKLKRKAHELLKGEKTYISETRYKEMIAARKAKKKTKTNSLAAYAEETGKPSFSGASGSDLAELQKRFGGKRK
jgi:hypothetical protein